MEMETKSCAICGAGFARRKKCAPTRWAAQKYCSRKCGADAALYREIAIAEEKRANFVRSLVPNGDCLEFSGTTMSGYGRIRIAGRAWLTHRLAYNIAFGEIPSGLLVCHRCDNPVCCNPDHLFLGTPKDNMDDMDRKGRRKIAPLKGEQAPRSRLTDSDVLAIRASADRNRDLAKMYAVGEDHISRIRSRQRWCHIS